MEEIKKEWEKYSPSEKLIAIDAYLDGMAKLDDADEALNNERLEWLRAHLPAYDPADGKNYIFISYSHRDYKKVYSDLAYFSYNSQRRVRFWYDEGLPVGKDWEAAAGKFMADKHCVGVIFYLSKNLLLSPSVFKEIQAVKKFGKPYFAVALNGSEYFAEKILQKATEEERLSLQTRRNDLADFFPDNNTAITYYEDTAFARINTISRFFDVTEEVFADFQCGECEDGLYLKSYSGNSAEIRIPELIDGKPIVEIDSNFFKCSANSVFIPKTVKRIYTDGRYCKNYYCDFEEFIVDKDNPNYYDINGVLCAKTGELLRAPRRWNWKQQFESVADAIKMRVSAAARIIDFESSVYEKNNNVQMNIVQFCDIMGYCFYLNEVANGKVKKVTKEARQNKNLFYECCLDLKNKSLFYGIKKIESGAFSDCINLDFMFLPDTVETVEESAFQSSNLKLICLSENLEEIPINCFAHCTQLTTVLTKFDGNKKYGNKFDIRDALFLDKIKKIESNAFLNTFIEYAVFGDNVIGIANCAFADCYLLKYITFSLPQNLSAAELTSFTGCGSISKINFNGTKNEWTYFSLKSEASNGFPPEFKRAAIVCTDGIIPPAEEE